jgi:hypothetical protein
MLRLEQKGRNAIRMGHVFRNRRVEIGKLAPKPQFGNEGRTRWHMLGPACERIAHRRKTTVRTALLLILSSSPMIEPLFDEFMKRAIANWP